MPQQRHLAARGQHEVFKSIAYFGADEIC